MKRQKVLMIINLLHTSVTLSTIVSYQFFPKRHLTSSKKKKKKIGHTGQEPRKGLKD